MRTDQIRVDLTILSNEPLLRIAAGVTTRPKGREDCPYIEPAKAVLSWVQRKIREAVKRQGGEDPPGPSTRRRREARP